MRRLISGPRVFICEGCVALCVQIIDQEGERKKAAAASDAASGDEKQPEDPSKPPPSCNFCGKLQKEVESMIAGPTIYICNECVGLCVEIVEGRA